VLFSSEIVLLNKSLIPDITERWNWTKSRTYDSFLYSYILMIQKIQVN